MGSIAFLVLGVLALVAVFSIIEGPVAGMRARRDLNAAIEARTHDVGAYADNLRHKRLFRATLLAGVVMLIVWMIMSQLPTYGEIQQKNHHLKDSHGPDYYPTR